MRRRRFLDSLHRRGLPARSPSVTEARRAGAGHDHHPDREQFARTEVLVEHHETGQRGDRRVERHQHAEHRLRETAQRLDDAPEPDRASARHLATAPACRQHGDVVKCASASAFGHAWGARLNNELSEASACPGCGARLTPTRAAPARSASLHSQPAFVQGPAANPCVAAACRTRRSPGAGPPRGQCAPSGRGRPAAA
jgi:hypothetical protein